MSLKYMLGIIIEPEAKDIFVFPSKQEKNKIISHFGIKLEIQIMYI